MGVKSVSYVLQNRPLAKLLQIGSITVVAIQLKSELTHVKDKQLAQNKVGVVYKLDCNECNAVYVGDTWRQVKDRMREHQNDIAKSKPLSKAYI